MSFSGDYFLICLLLCSVSQAEVQLLYERFQKLGPDGDGRLNRSVFQKPPYSTDPFSRQVIYLLYAVLRTHNFVFDGMRIRGQQKADGHCRSKPGIWLELPL